jgi:DNA-binding CsgD family transcriptional regulator
MSVVGGARHDPRQWRYELLSGLMEILLMPEGTTTHAGSPGTAAAMVVKGMRSAPMVMSMIDAGFTDAAQRQAFQEEFHTAPFNDPFSRLAAERFQHQQLSTMTCLRADLVNDADWSRDLHVQTHRRKSGLDDCLLSLHRGSSGEDVIYAIYIFRSLSSQPSEGSPGSNESVTKRFSARERLLLDVIHRGLEGIYRVEESTHRLDPATGLRPRVRQALEYLLNGDTERQVALKMSISVHTVHDYVKSLYTHFGVSSRNELLARWVQNGGQLPPRETP